MDQSLENQIVSSTPDITRPLPEEKDRKRRGKTTANGSNSYDLEKEKVLEEQSKFRDVNTIVRRKTTTIREMTAATETTSSLASSATVNS
jgi:hypothetical protein